MERIVIKQNLIKTIGGLLGCMLFVGISVWFIYYIFEHVNEPDTYPRDSRSILVFYRYIVIPMSIACILLLTPLILYYFKLLITNRPMLVIEENGFTNYSSILTVGFISWGGVISIEKLVIHTQGGKQTFIGVSVKNINEILQKFPRYKKVIIRLMYSLNRSQIHITLNFAKGNIDEVMSTMQKYLDSYRIKNMS